MNQKPNLILTYSQKFKFIREISNGEQYGHILNMTAPNPNQIFVASERAIRIWDVSVSDSLDFYLSLSLEN